MMRKYNKLDEFIHYIIQIVCMNSQSIAVHSNVEVKKRVIIILMIIKNNYNSIDILHAGITAQWQITQLGTRHISNNNIYIYMFINASSWKLY
jgi:hypothetical protein